MGSGPDRPGRARAEVWLRRVLLGFAAAAAVAAVASGLARMGFALRLGEARAGEHGPLFVVGLFGTVIALERAVALGGRLALLAPGLAALAGAMLLLGTPGGAGFATASAGALVLLNLTLARRQWAPFTGLMLLGSVSLLAGSLAWSLDRPVFQVAPAWIGFFVLTIVAERLELSRLQPTPRWAQHAVLGLGLAHAVTAGGYVLGLGLAPRLFGLTLLGLGIWQLRFDLARRTLRQAGLPRFAAAGILLGAAWLAASGLLFLSTPIPVAGPLHDAALHGVFVGYVLSMVFAHAPIILPAVAKVALPFHPILYAPLAVLHLGLFVRVAGDLLAVAVLRETGGLLNALALVSFAAAVLYARRSS